MSLFVLALLHELIVAYFACHLPFRWERSFDSASCLSSRPACQANQAKRERSSVSRFRCSTRWHWLSEWRRGRWEYWASRIQDASGSWESTVHHRLLFQLSSRIVAVKGHRWLAWVVRERAGSCQNSSQWKRGLVDGQNTSQAKVGGEERKLSELEL